MKLSIDYKEEIIVNPYYVVAAKLDEAQLPGDYYEDTPQLQRHEEVRGSGPGYYVYEENYYYEGGKYNKVSYSTDEIAFKQAADKALDRIRAHAAQLADIELPVTVKRSFRDGSLEIDDAALPGIFEFARKHAESIELAGLSDLIGVCMHHMEMNTAPESHHNKDFVLTPEMEQTYRRTRRYYAEKDVEKWLGEQKTGVSDEVFDELATRYDKWQGDNEHWWDAISDIYVEVANARGFSDHVEPRFSLDRLPKTYDEVAEIIESQLGDDSKWKVDFWKVNDDGSAEWLLEAWSPEGEDLPLEGNCSSPETALQEISKELTDVYCCYDAEDHAELNIDMRGERGVPESVRALVDDAEEIGKMYGQLRDKIAPLADAAEKLREAAPAKSKPSKAAPTPKAKKAAAPADDAKAASVAAASRATSKPTQSKVQGK